MISESQSPLETFQLIGELLKLADKRMDLIERRIDALDKLATRAINLLGGKEDER